VRRGVNEERTYGRHQEAENRAAKGRAHDGAEDERGDAQETLDTYGHLWPDSEDRTRTAVEEALGGALGGGEAVLNQSE
jgi:hypothetical protein